MKCVPLGSGFDFKSLKQLYKKGKLALYFITRRQVRCGDIPILSLSSENTIKTEDRIKKWSIVLDQISHHA